MNLFWLVIEIMWFIIKCWDLEPIQKYIWEFRLQQEKKLQSKRFLNLSKTKSNVWWVWILLISSNWTHTGKIMKLTWLIWYWICVGGIFDKKWKSVIKPRSWNIFNMWSLEWMPWSPKIWYIETWSSKIFWYQRMESLKLLILV